MQKYLRYFERVVITSLIGLLGLVVFISVVELGWILLQDLMSPPFLLLEIDELFEIFGFFLLILIGIELMESTRAYLTQGVMHSEIVLTVAIIALARKVIILEAGEYHGVTLVGIGAIFVGLAVAYFVIKRARCMPETSIFTPRNSDKPGS